MKTWDVYRDGAIVAAGSAACAVWFLLDYRQRYPEYHWMLRIA